MVWKYVLFYFFHGSPSRKKKHGSRVCDVISKRTRFIRLLLSADRPGASSPVKICFSAAGVGVGTRREKSKNSAARARARLFFALASKNSAAAPVVSRARRRISSTRSRATRRRIRARTQHVHVVCTFSGAPVLSVGPPPVTPTEQHAHTRIIVRMCGGVFRVIVIFKAAAAASNRPHNFRISPRRPPLFVHRILHVHITAAAAVALCPPTPPSNVTPRWCYSYYPSILQDPLLFLLYYDYTGYYKEGGSPYYKIHAFTFSLPLTYSAGRLNYFYLYVNVVKKKKKFPTRDEIFTIYIPHHRLLHIVVFPKHASNSRVIAVDF